MLPPSLPVDIHYTSCYCEENVYLLAKKFFENSQITSIWDIFVVFISNHTRTVALWNQKLAREAHHPVVWDYHVILLLRPRSYIPGQASLRRTLPVDGQLGLAKTWIYDFDTRLGFPCTLEEYMGGTIMDVILEFQSSFRVVTAEVYINNFASDRSHMLTTDSTYISPPPVHEPICGVIAAERGISNNLMSSFVSMRPSLEAFGEVLDKEMLLSWC